MIRFHYLFVPLALSGVLLPCPAALAQGGQPPQRLVLQALDTNGDGVLSDDEIEHASASLLKLDRNHDGQLTQDEYLPADPRDKTADETVSRLMAMDKNGDGVLTPEELPDRMQAMFQRGDSNHDGKLTPEEIRAMVQGQSGLQGRPVGKNGAEGMSRMDPLINVIDIDHDGVLSAAEIASASGALKQLDTNADGTLQAAEIRVRQQTPGERAAHVLDEWDTNKDGVLTKEESPDRLQKQFEAIDANHDGKLNLEELTTFFATTQTQPGQAAAPRNDAPAATQLPGATGQTARPVQPQ